MGNRDPFLRKMAQKVITDEAEQVKLKRQAIISAVAAVKKRYLQSLKDEAVNYLKVAEAKGEYRPLSAKEEGEIVAKVTGELMAEHRKAAAVQIAAQIKDEVHKEVIAGRKQIYTAQEAEVMVKEATESAEAWIKQQGVISLEEFNKARIAIYQNLRRMGHSHDDVMAIYGKPDLKRNPLDNPVASSITDWVLDSLKKP